MDQLSPIPPRGLWISLNIWFLVFVIWTAPYLWMPGWQTGVFCCFLCLCWCQHTSVQRSSALFLCLSRVSGITGGSRSSYVSIAAPALRCQCRALLLIRCRFCGWWLTFLFAWFVCYIRLLMWSHYFWLHVIFLGMEAGVNLSHGDIVYYCIWS